MRKIAIIFIFALIQMQAFSAQAGITVTPERHVVLLQPGEETVVKYQAYNSGKKDVSVTIEPESWSGNKDPYEWLEIKSNNAYIKAGQASPIVVRVFTPEDAAGEMVAMLFLCYKDAERSQLNIRNGVPLYLIIKGTEDYSLDIDNIEVTYTKNINNVNDLNVLVKVENTGNVHIVPDVKVSVEDSKGEILKDMFLSQPSIVLRGKSNVYRLGWRNPFLKDGIYTVTAELNYEDKIPSVVREGKFEVSGNNISMLMPEKESK